MSQRRSAVWLRYNNHKLTGWTSHQRAPLSRRVRWICFSSSLQTSYYFFLSEWVSGIKCETQIFNILDCGQYILILIYLSNPMDLIQFSRWCKQGLIPFIGLESHISWLQHKVFHLWDYWVGTLFLVVDYDLCFLCCTTCINSPTIICDDCVGWDLFFPCVTWSKH